MGNNPLCWFAFLPGSSSASNSVVSMYAKDASVFMKPFHIGLERCHRDDSVCMCSDDEEVMSGLHGFPFLKRDA